MSQIKFSFEIIYEESTFSLLIEIEFCFKDLIISDFEDKNSALKRKSWTRGLSLIWSNEIVILGTPSKISKNVFSSRLLKSSEVDFPNKIFDAIIEFSKSSSEWTSFVRNSAMVF